MKLILLIAIVSTASIITLIAFIGFSPNEPPVAVIETHDIQPFNTNITFNGSKSNDPDGAITRWNWNFGDGHNESGEIVNHSFSTYGHYTVTLTVTDNRGLSAHSTFNITIYGNPPVADITGPSLAHKKTSVFFDASSSHGVNGTIISYEWEFEDGTNETGITISHQFSPSGNYQVQLCVTDEWGATDEAIHSINMINLAPSASCTSNGTMVPPNTVLIFDASASSDLDGDPLNYSWNFNDGSDIAFGMIVYHSFTTSRSYAVSLIVTDDDINDPRQANKMLLIRVNEPPIANFTIDPDSSWYVGVPLYFNGSISYDPDGEIVQYYWDFGDPNDPTPSIGQNATHTYNYAGPYTVTLTVTDNYSINGTKPVPITIYPP